MLINISDHHVRMRANNPNGTAVAVVGCLLGSQPGRVVDISNSFEMKFTSEGQIDMPFLAKKQEQCEGCARQCGQCSCEPSPCGWRRRGALWPPMGCRGRCRVSADVSKLCSFHGTTPCSSNARRPLHRGLQSAAPGFALRACRVADTASRAPPLVVPLACLMPAPDKSVFPKLEVVGWYGTGAQLEPTHLALHKQVSHVGEARGSPAPANPLAARETAAGSQHFSCGAGSARMD